MIVSPSGFPFYQLPNATIGVPYNQVITVTDGTPPYTFSIFFGALPSGMTLTDNGDGTATISGTPTASGIFNVRLSIGDQVSAGFYNYRINSVIKKKRRKMIASPIICCDFKSENCPPQVQYSGYYYDRIGNTKCYILRRK